ncbi:MAG: FtsL-like putative cell division protein [Chitinophagales bacterium]|jgi:hypothetical protein
MKIPKAFQWSKYSTEWVFANFRFVSYICFLVLAYIANAHFAEKSVREIQRKENEIKQLKWEYITIKSETMFKSMQSQLDENLDVDLYENGPKVIVVE